MRFVRSCDEPSAPEGRRCAITAAAMAKRARAAALLVGDIDAGGIFAQVLGTLRLLTPSERTLIKGVVVNKFRGERSLFADGVRILEQKGGKPVLGVLPRWTKTIPRISNHQEK